MAVRYEKIISFINIEMSNLLSDDERKLIESEISEEFKEVVDMSPEFARDLQRTISRVNEKTITEAKEDARLEGIAVGRVEGQAEAKDEILKLFSELSDAGLDKDQIFEELSRRFNAGK